jgi:hypothetical protein
MLQLLPSAEDDGDSARSGAVTPASAGGDVARSGDGERARSGGALLMSAGDDDLRLNPSDWL